MSIEITPNNKTTAVGKSVKPDTEVASSNREVSHGVQELEIPSVKREYSIVGDAFYAGINSDTAPYWLTSLLSSAVDSAVSAGLTDYDSLVQDVRSAIDSIDTAKNAYTERISFTGTLEDVVGVHLEAINATVGEVASSVVDLGVVQSNARQALAQNIQDIQAQFSEDVNSRITLINSAVSDVEGAHADSIAAIALTFKSQETEQQALADVVKGVQTYVGVDETTSYPNGTGMLARMAIVERQNDGVVEYVSGSYDVMLGIEDPNNNTDNDQLDVTKEPYASWISEDRANGNDDVRSIHIGDVYMQHTGGVNPDYVRSFKFIRTVTDDTSPYATDTEGYTWALITDSDANAAYALASKANDLADGKRRVFTGTPFAPYDAGDLWIRDDSDPQTIMVARQGSASVYSINHWKIADQQLKDFVDNTYLGDSAQIHRQLDGKVEYFFYESYLDVSGATDEAKALQILNSGFTSDESKDNANGNIVYFKDSTNAYWYQSSTSTWVSIEDTSLFDAVQVAADAKGAADGKVSQFYAWGGVEAPLDYVITIKEEVLDSDGNVVQAKVEETVPASNFLYWFSSGVLKYKPGNDWVNVPTSSTGSTYVSEGDLVTVFDPIQGDMSVYSYNGTSWQSSGPSGIISSSKWFVDLTNTVDSIDGKIGSAVSGVFIDNKAYTDQEALNVESKFVYDSVLTIGGKQYKTGFGLVADGSEAVGDGSTENPFSSEFWVDVDKFVLKSSQYPEVSAVFTPTADGIKLSLDNTEATKNEAKGVHSLLSIYDKGDIVFSSGSSYIAKQDVPEGTPINSLAYWQLFAEKGVSADALTVEVVEGSESTALNFSDGTSFTVNNGEAGKDGETGKSAYQEWLDIGNTGTEEGFIDFLNAEDGVDGNTWHSGEDYPITSLGEVGDFYLKGGRYVYENVENSGWTFLQDLQGEASGVTIVYAYDSSGSNPSFEQEDRKYANYYEWSITPPSNVDELPDDLTYTLFIAKDGDKAGVIPIYSDTPEGANTSFEWTGQEYVNFYEWEVAPPTTTPAGLKYVKFVGKDGASYTGTTEYYMLTNTSTVPSRTQGTWSITPLTPTATNKYLWNHNANFVDNVATSWSPVTLLTQYVQDGEPGRGISGITEQYQVGSSSTEAPTGTWKDNFSDAGQLTESNPYMWNKTTISFTSGVATETTYTMIAAKGDKGDKGDSIQGSSGSGSYIRVSTISSENKAWAEGRTSAQRDFDFEILVGRDAQQFDSLEYTNNTSDESGYSVSYVRGATSWSGFLSVVDGNQLIKGTVVADSLVADIVIAEDAVFKGKVEGGTVVVGSTTLTESNTLNSNTTAEDVDLGNVDNTSDSQIRAVGAATSGSVGGWTIDSNSIYSGSKDTGGFAPAGSFTLYSEGSIHTPWFYSQGSGSAFKGDISSATGTLTAAKIVASNITGDLVDGDVVSVPATNVNGSWKTIKTIKVKRSVDFDIWLTVDDLLPSFNSSLGFGVVYTHLKYGNSSGKVVQIDAGSGNVDVDIQVKGYVYSNSVDSPVVLSVHSQNAILYSYRKGSGFIV